jgi:hypothetical protein
LDSVSTETGLDITASTASTAEINLITNWVNKGIVDLLKKTRCYVRADQMILAANANDYTISTSILELISLDLTPASGAIGSGLKRVGLDEIIERRRVAQIVMAPYMYAFTGSDLISFFPTPAAADTATIYYVPLPTALSNTADDPSTTGMGGIPTMYHDAIEYYAMARAASYDDDDGGSQQYWKMYQGRFREIRREIQRMGGTKLPLMKTRSRFGRGRRNFGLPPYIDTGWGR